MPILELTLRCREAEQPRLERALDDLGALSVTLMDAHADAPDEQAIFEPGVGRTPLWGEMTLAALFVHGTDGDLVLAALESFDPELDLSTAAFRVVEDQDWERAWLDSFRPMRFGARTWIVPWNHPIPDEADSGEAAVVRLDPGLAFGSGTHPTTALCLEWLDAQDLRDRTVLDYGCGSGVLAVAALELGAASATAVDNDPQALTATLDNAERNGVATRIAVFAPEEAPAARYDLVVANILASALDALADTLAARVKPGGRIALSGVLAGQEGGLVRRYAEWFDALAVARREDWIRVDGVRREGDRHQSEP